MKRVKLTKALREFDAKCAANRAELAAWKAQCAEEMLVAREKTI